MTLLFERSASVVSPSLAPSRPARDDARPASRPLELALVNNMPDAAIKATERQFTRLLTVAADGRPFRLRTVTLQDVPRSAVARAHLARHALGFDALSDNTIDGLIVTGAEPRAATLQGEVYWDSLRRVIDWAETHTRSAIFSCLAAHAAVLHLDGIERRRLPQKCSGVFRCNSRATHWLGRDLDPAISVAHSRLNELPTAALVGRSYEIVTHSAAVGADVFTKRVGSSFVFFQGHPEYEACSLKREYLRDIGRFVSGERDDYPALPEGYFDPPTETVLRAFQQRIEHRRDPALLQAIPALGLRARVFTDMERAADALFRGWIDHLAEARA